MRTLQLDMTVFFALSLQIGYFLIVREKLAYIFHLIKHH